MGKYPIRKCPDCTGSLTFIPLNSSFDFPNEYNMSCYICKKCTKKYGKTKQIMFNSTELKPHSTKGKFPSATKYSEKIKRVLDRTRNINTSDIDSKSSKTFCTYCKLPLYYDKNSSQVYSNNGLRVRVYFHFDCPKTNINQIMYFMIRGNYKQTEFLRVIQG